MAPVARTSVCARKAPGLRGHQHIELDPLCSKRASTPDGRVAPDLGALVSHTRDEGLAHRVLGVARRSTEAVRRRGLLQILPARASGLVEDNDLDAMTGRGLGGGETGRASAHDHERQAALAERARALGQRGLDRRQLVGATDAHAGRELDPAGPLAAPAVDLDQAVVADAHAAERAARGAVPGPAEARAAVPQQGRHQALALDAFRRRVVDEKGGRRAAADEARTLGQARGRSVRHRAGSSPSSRSSASSGGHSSAGSGRRGLLGAPMSMPISRSAALLALT